MMSATIRDGGGFLAEVRALEAAGAEMIGLDGDGPEHQIIVGAIAAVTASGSGLQTTPPSFSS